MIAYEKWSNWKREATRWKGKLFQQFCMLQETCVFYFSCSYAFPKHYIHEKRSRQKMFCNIPLQLNWHTDNTKTWTAINSLKESGYWGNTEVCLLLQQKAAGDFREDFQEDCQKGKKFGNTQNLMQNLYKDMQIQWEVRHGIDYSREENFLIQQVNGSENFRLHVKRCHLIIKQQQETNI